MPPAPFKSPICFLRGNIVVSGTKSACDEVERVGAGFLLAMKTIRLAVAGAFHTNIMKPADRILAAALENVAFKPPRLPVWSNVDAAPHSDPAEIRGLLVRQVLQPVLWEKTMRHFWPTVAIVSMKSVPVEFWPDCLEGCRGKWSL